MIKLFISYSHPDNTYVEEFRRFIAPLCENDRMEAWYDRNITAGDDFWNQIDSHLEDRDIVCLFVSSYYLASKACKEEMRQAFEMKKNRGIAVIPIILSPCMWLENENLKKNLALPTDGKPISDFDDQDKAWLDVCNGLKSVVERLERIKVLKFKAEHINFLNDASLFTKAHENKEVLKMEDIFVSPELEKYNEEKNKREKLSFDLLVENFEESSKIVIAGEDQSGKTSIAKVFIQRLRGKNFIPVYLKDEEELLQGDLKYRVEQLFKESSTKQTGI